MGCTRGSPLRSRADTATRTPTSPVCPAPCTVHNPPLYPVILAPLFGLLSVGAAALVGKLLNVLLAAASAGLITWHLLSTNLLGEKTPRWIPPALVTAAAISIPVLAMQSVLFAEPLFAV